MEHYTNTAIVHVDADAFFASCEQAVNPAYKGKPVVTGRERGIVAAASYEAKAFGVRRGVPLRDVRKLCPGIIILPSNYETYSLFSKRMFEILRRYTSDVEEYSIDEAFADITGLRRPLNMSYEEIGRAMKEAIQRELGITVTVGLASSKVLAKIGSSQNKPDGFMYVRNSEQRQHLDIPTQEVWGIGPQTARHLTRQGMKTALEFAQKPQWWVEQNMTKPHQELWRELHGESVFRVNMEAKRMYASISKTKTFTPASSSKTFVFGQLSKNVENAFIKVRRYNLAAKHIVIYLKTQEFRYAGIKAGLNRATAFPNEAMPIVHKLFNQLWQIGVEYRSTGVVLFDLQEDGSIQLNLFEKTLNLEKQQRLYKAADKLSQQYGKHTVFLGSSLPAQQVSQHQTGRGELPAAKQLRNNQINKRKFVNLPLLMGKVK